MNTLAVTALLILLLPVPGRAAEGRTSGFEVTVSYEEPRVNTDRSPLGDLKKTTVYWHWTGKPNSVTKAVEVPASRRSGGGKVRVTLVIPPPPGQEREVTIYTTASDEKGHESGRSNEASIRLDRLRPYRPGKR
jgi:hypothetical protein